MTISKLKEKMNQVSGSELKIKKAIELVSVLESHALDYVKLVECRKNTDPKLEMVILSIEVERSQILVHDIRPTEEIAILFADDDTTPPEILAIRNDFPNVPHLNLREYESPKSLCLFEQPYTEMRSHWTATRLIKQIHHWLSQTAKGMLHQDDQPLEPLFLSSKIRLVIPDDFIKDEGSGDLIRLRAINLGDRHTLIVDKENFKIGDNSNEFVAAIINCPPQKHGVIHKKPGTLHELHGILSTVGIDLITILRENLKKWQEEKKIDNLLQKNLVLIVIFPKTRKGGTSIEATDIYGFFCLENIMKVGEGIGVWKMVNDVPGFVLVPDKSGEEVFIDLCQVHYGFSRDLATKINGLSSMINTKIAMIGLGALGSQIFMNLIRSGVGKWGLIDSDILLPHNLARHVLNHSSVGFSKAINLAKTANYLLGEIVVESAICDDILTPVDYRQKIHDLLLSSETILDCSASIGVPRYLAAFQTKARVISCFLNPSGKALIILVEDKKRDVRIDHLEMQYYRFLLSQHELEDHLESAEGRIRYSNTCRDISSVIQQDFVAVTSGIASKVIKETIQRDDARIIIWKIDSEMAIRKYEAVSAKTIRQNLGEWTIITDQLFLDKMSKFRKERLPNETGGVLIGSFDLNTKTVYVVDTILSPSDSKEWPTSYIRGCEGLQSEVDRIKKVTSNNLEYIGEWHSHPDGYGCSPSQDDRKALKLLNGLMFTEGLPGMMVIVGDKDSFGFYINQM